MKNILLIPRYFPTKSSPIIGSQVKEQTELMQDEFRFAAIYCLPGMGWKRFLFQVVFGWLLKNKVYKNCTDQLLGGNINASGVYFFQSKYFSERLNFYLLKSAYIYATKHLQGTGFKPDLIHSRTVEHRGELGNVLSERFSIPHLMTENCLFILDGRTTQQKIINYRNALENASKVAVVSHYLKAFILSNNINCEPFIIGNMVDDDVFSLKSKKTSDTFNIFTAGHTGFTKDWVTFFKVIERLSQIIPKEKLEVTIAVTNVYDDWSRNLVPKLADQFGVEDHCKIMFQVDREKMVGLFKSADVFLSTSVNETFGIATLESMSCGTPVVSTRNGGIQDFSTDENSVLCNIKDYKCLSDAIVKIYNGQLIFKPQTVRSSIINMYGKVAFKNRLSSLYKNVIEGHLA